MRIFERLRGRERRHCGIERQHVGTIATDLLRRMEDEVPLLTAPESKSSCCSCCSAEPESSV
jgi:hypothetical protein